MTDVIPFTPRLDGLVPPHLTVRSAKIHLDGLAVMTDIGFHDFEVWLDETAAPDGDLAAGAWNYDHLRLEIERIASSRRFNLQETVVREIYDWIAARAGVKALKVGTSKPDVYPNARGVGVEIASFSGSAP
jgi:dihydroneopterin aldolase